jgi:acetolactate synthase-1/2/3 large subunit
VFAVGCSLAPGRRYGGFKHHIPDTKRSDLNLRSGKIIVQSTVDPTDVNRYYQVDHAIIGDAKHVLNQLIGEVEKRGPLKRNEKLINEIKDAKREDQDKYMALMVSNERPINPYRVYRDLMETIDRKNSFATHDSGGPREQLALVYEATVPHGFMGWGAVSTLGFGLGAAIGARLAFPEREVVNVTGDAGIGYQLGDYEVLVRNKIPITTIHINNSGFSGYGPGSWGPGSAPYTADVTPSTIQSTARAVESLGEYSERIENPDEIIPALKKAFKENKAGRPAFLEVICSHHPLRGWLAE